MSTAFHPQSDGQTERVNQVLEAMLRHYVGPLQDNWDELLPLAEFAINNSHHEGLRETPFFLNYGQHPIAPGSLVQLERYYKVPAAKSFTARMHEALQSAKASLRLAADRYKSNADRHRRDVTLEVGQSVLLNAKNIHLRHQGTRKLLPRWLGPFKVLERVGPVAYRLELPASLPVHPVFHVSLLQTYRSDGRTQPPPPPAEVDGAVEYEVEELLHHRITGTKRPKRMFLVKWKGFGPENSTWEPESHLTNAPDILRRYLQRVGISG
jgi:hypothetical protein